MRVSVCGDHCGTCVCQEPAGHDGPHECAAFKHYKGGYICFQQWVDGPDGNPVVTRPSVGAPATV